MFSRKSLVFATISIVAAHLAVAGEYNERQMLQIEDLFNTKTQKTMSVVQNIESVMQLDEEMTLENLDSIDDVRRQMVYTLGARTRGDRLVAKASKNQSWPSPYNVNIQLTYPSQGAGALVTFVYIVVNQSSNLGRAYVVRGGLHQRFLTVIVEANNTTYANYHAEIYGI